MIRIGVIAAVLLMSGCSEPGARTAEEAANISAREAETEAFNAQQLGLVERFYGEDWIYLSYVPWAPQGMSNNREAIKQGNAAGVLFFPDRKITVKSRVAEGDTVVDESEWIGTASDQHPTLQEGEREVIRFISYNRYRDGKIVETREYGVAVSEVPAQEPEP